jgi:hypothetical protein
MHLAYILAVLAVAGAMTSWFAGAWFYVQTLRAISAAPGRSGLMLRAFVAWPFALNRLHGEAAAQAVKVNKAMVAFLACLTVAVAAISVATNLARVSS